MDIELWMQRCLDLAMQGAGFVSPNPMVGSVIVSPEGDVLGEGFHARFGGPHAEVEAIRDADESGFADQLKDATLFVNLEPCSHYGKTPPCSDLILDKRIPSVVIAMRDPNPIVAGRGLKRLRDAGVDVAIGVLETKAKRLNEAFSQHITSGKPLVTLKIAQSKDGTIATPEGAPTNITSIESRTLVHKWRSELDAVLVGSETARTDDPQLTVRHVVGRQPLRVVLDRKGKLPPSLKLFSDEFASRTAAFVGEGTTPAYEGGVKRLGGRVIRVSAQDGHLDLHAVLQILGSGEGLDQPIQSVLVEAGPSLATALLEQNLVDRLFLFTSPHALVDGKQGLDASRIEQLAFAEVKREMVGSDELFRGYVRSL